MKNHVITRFAPSPTGYLHIGGARTALYNFLFARKNKGKFILRIEDTDKQRSKPEFEKDIIDSLNWLGINFDEFYRQSERQEIYLKYLTKLLESNKAFYCYHTREDLDNEREILKKQGKPQVHWCNNKNQSLNIKNQKGVIRLKVEQGIDIKFNDLLRGDISINTENLGDFVIAKDLNNPLYNFAAAVDDIDLNITHIIRGEEHIANTPKQILLYNALNQKTPQFVHLPLILGQDRAKLSKRHGATAIKKFRELGYLPNALVNFLALLGWHPQGNQEIFTMQQLIDEFSITKAQKSPAIFDQKKLDSLNSYYIKRLSDEEFANLCLPYLIEAGLISQDDFIKRHNEIVKILSLEKQRIKILCDIKNAVDFMLKNEIEYNKELILWKDQTFKEAKMILNEIKNQILSQTEFNKTNLQNILDKISENLGNNKGKVYWPLRVALSGRSQSPGPLEIAQALGKEKTIKRIEQAINKISTKNID